MTAFEQVIDTIEAEDGALAAAEACSKIAGLLNRWAGALTAHAADTVECGVRYAARAVHDFEALAAAAALDAGAGGAAAAAADPDGERRLADGLEAALFWQALNLATLCGAREAGGRAAAADSSAAAARRAVDRLRGLYAARGAPAAEGDAHVWFVEGVLRLHAARDDPGGGGGAAEGRGRRMSRDASFWGPGSPLHGVVEHVRAAVLRRAATADTGPLSQTFAR